jgi:hypothetical protein
MRLIDFQYSSIWKQIFVDLRTSLETIEINRLLNVTKLNAEEEILQTWNSIPIELLKYVCNGYNNNFHLNICLRIVILLYELYKRKIKESDD